jgi:hypothetical protein
VLLNDAVNFQVHIAAVINVRFISVHWPNDADNGTSKYVGEDSNGAVLPVTSLTWTGRGLNLRSP